MSEIPDFGNADDSCHAKLKLTRKFPFLHMVVTTNLNNNQLDQRMPDFGCIAEYGHRMLKRNDDGTWADWEPELRKPAGDE